MALAGLVLAAHGCAPTRANDRLGREDDKPTIDVFVQPSPGRKAPPQLSGPPEAGRLSVAHQTTLARQDDQDREYARDPRRALRVSGAALASHADSALHHYLHGRLLGKAGRLEEARRAFEKAIQFDSGYPWGHYGLGIYHSRKQQWEEARRCFEKALDAAPSEVRFLDGQARVLGIGFRKLAEAIPLLRRAVRVEPSYTPTYRSLAGMLFAQGKAQEAIRVLERAQRRAPREVDTHVLLGRFLEEIGSHHRAREVYRAALSLEADPAQKENLRFRVQAVTERLRRAPAPGLSKRARTLVEATLLPNAAIRQQAYRIMRTERNPIYVPSLLRGLGDPSDPIRVLCVYALGELRTKKPVERLLEVLARDASPLVRGAVTKALEDIDESACVPRLVARLEVENSAYVLEQVHGALRRLTGEEPVLVPMEPEKILAMRPRMHAAWKAWYDREHGKKK